MIASILSILLCIVFLILGGFHFYWLFGGIWGVKMVIPTKDNNLNNLYIPKIATLIVALGLVLIGVLYLLKLEFINIKLPSKILQYGYWIIPSIFTLRAIGDFNYVGFFKKIKHTEFAKADTKIFSPLCLVIAITGFLLQFIK